MVAGASSPDTADEIPEGIYDGDGDLEPTAKGEAWEEQHSPIEQVDLTVPNTDDHTLPTWTFRVWVLGLLACAALSYVNQFFYFRSQSLIITTLPLQILTLLGGRFMALIIPRWGFLEYLNPGPFNVKEHVLITIFANAGSGFGSGPAYGADIVTLIKKYYNSDIKMLPAMILVITTQVLGLGWAGLLRRFLVEPAAMWWPANLVNVSLFSALHERTPHHRWSMTRFRWFALIAIISFGWYAGPDYLFFMMISMSWVCWVWRKSVLAHQLGSGLSGLGLGAFTLDWSTIASFNGSPLATPWSATWNIFAGFVIVLWILCPIFYWNNVYNAKTFPIISSNLFKADGSNYDIQEILNDDLTVNKEKLAEYGQVHLSAFFAFTYGVGFAALSATVSHVALWHGKEILQQTFAAASMKKDIHTRLMERYKKIPEWWFLVTLVVTLGLSIFLVEHWSIIQLPWWGVLFATGMAAFFSLPVGIIAATTNQVPGLNVITEMVLGYILPGKPIANITFKTYGYISMTQAVAFLQDFKLGHYMKIPPIENFWASLIGTIVAAVINVATTYYLLDGVDGICDPDERTWSCPSSQVFFDASVIWGLIGPRKFFAIGAEYFAQNIWWAIGFLAPIPPWLLYKAFPKQKWLKKVNMAILIGATGILPPASAINFTSFFVVGFIFNYLIFHRAKTWWGKYNYITSAALDTGVAFMGILLFFALSNRDKSFQNWWGNNPFTDRCELAGCPTAPGVVVDGCPVF